MFDDLKQNDATDKVDDIFAESEQDNNEPTKNPQPSVADLNLKKPEMNNAIPQFDDENKSRSKKMIKTILLIVIILVIVLISAYFVYSKILLPKTLNVDNNINNSNTISNNLVNTSDESADSTGLIGTGAGEVMDVETGMEEYPMDEFIDDEENSEAMDVLKNIDSDSDGLFDYDETYVYKTDPNLFDTDNDMINDYDEVMIFGTNPLLLDSDNDTYLDGKEIMSGYNPLGEGKLNPLLLKDQNLFVEKYPELAGK